jgi:membrane associated rhomboid family serine protease
MLNEFKGAFNKPNNSHIQLIIINVVVFLVLGIFKVIADLGGAGEIFYAIDRQFMIPPTIGEFFTRPWTMVTYMFNHSGLMHILFNMLWFYFFGKLIIEYLGNEKLISIYVVGGIAGAVAYLFMYNVVPFYIERSGGPGMVGASAAIDAIVIAAATLLPNYTIHLMFVGPVKIKYIAIFTVVISVLSATGGNAGGNIAHLGGAGMGYLYVKLLQSGTDVGRWVIVVMNYFQSFFIRQPKMKVSSKKKKTKAPASSASSSSTMSNIADQQEIDAILDKISQSGYESLSKEEKQKLFNASKN